MTPPQARLVVDWRVWRKVKESEGGAANQIRRRNNVESWEKKKNKTFFAFLWPGRAMVAESVVIWCHPSSSLSVP